MTVPLGLPSGCVVVVPYDPVWADLYAAEAARLQRVLLAHDVSLALEHTGSTAVPGLDAKPVLDMLGGRRASDDRKRIVVALQSAGYVHRGEQGISGRDFLRRGDPRQYHLHVALIDSKKGYRAQAVKLKT